MLFVIKRLYISEIHIKTMTKLATDKTNELEKKSMKYIAMTLRCHTVIKSVECKLIVEIGRIR